MQQESEAPRMAILMFFSHASSVALEMEMSVCRSVHYFLHISTTSGWVDMKLGTDIHDAQG